MHCGKKLVLVGMAVFACFSIFLGGCMSGPSSSINPDDYPSYDGTAKSSKRGIAYNLPDTADMSAICQGVSWWYNWGSSPAAGVPADYYQRYGMEYIPMLWNFDFNKSSIVNFILAHPEIKYLLVLNEPNLTDQANITPSQAALNWPKYEEVISELANKGRTIKLVGPAITWGTMTNYWDPVVWLDAFYAAYQNANDGRDPLIDYLAFHWYDYGLSGQLDRLTKYGKQFWVTEFANWHKGDGSAQIDTLEKQKAQMTDMVNVCESRADVFRYAWFIGRMSPDLHYCSIFTSTPGQLTELGSLYINLPFSP